MIKITAKVEGDVEFLKGMPRFKGNLLTSVENALEEVGLLIEERTREVTPVDTGRLKASIGHFDSSFLVKPNDEASPADAYWVLERDSVTVGTRVPYAHFVHDRVPFLDIGANQARGELDGILRGIVFEAASVSFGTRMRGTVSRIRKFFRGRR